MSSDRPTNGHPCRQSELAARVNDLEVEVRSARRALHASRKQHRRMARLLAPLAEALGFDGRAFARPEAPDLDRRTLLSIVRKIVRLSAFQVRHLHLGTPQPEIEEVDGEPSDQA